MRPHPYNLDGTLSTIDLIHQTMLKVDPARIGAGKISNQLFVRRRTLKRIFTDEVKKALDLRSEIGRGDFPGILLRLPGINDRPTHQPGFFEALLSGSA